MARKDGGESEGIVLYPSRSPSLGWKPTPLAPLSTGKSNPPVPPCQGGFSSTPSTGGIAFTPLTRGDRGVAPLTKAFSTTPHRWV